MDDDFKIADRLKSLRIQHKKTQHEIAAALGIADSVYQRYEHGARVPILSVVRSLCLFYEVSSDYFLGLVDDPVPLEIQQKRGKVKK